MQRGRLIASGQVEDLVQRTDTVSNRTRSPERALAVIHTMSGVRNGAVEDDRVLVDGAALRPGDLLLALDAAGIEVEGFRRGHSLEDAYLNLVATTGGSDDAQPAHPRP
jgi:hypothetical protein